MLLKKIYDKYKKKYEEYEKCPNCNSNEIEKNKGFYSCKVCNYEWEG